MEFEDLFYGTLGKWDTSTADLEANTGSKPFNARCYPAANTNKDTLYKELQQLVYIGVLNSVQQL